eukprot:CAMPEP_0183370540 /NCGR_PEP_ID=MMETSP0164_2-20130417/102722_1 /TAXON_ID=221442 /ORGANISM="Coccolithus pelagicus ssp braarudi, Strain PLY182g" /LENGTH=33 /DNA_ID= /DNA_START= /DNA_END= /DNA_ORIENTATION=
MTDLGMTMVWHVSFGMSSSLLPTSMGVAPPLLS